MSPQHDLTNARKILRSSLSKEDYDHSLRSAQTAKALARQFELDANKALVAGLLHDYGKGLGDGELVAEAERLGLPICDVERRVPYLLHAPVAARLIPEVFGVDDPTVLDAIAMHTLGAPVMSAFDKAIYLCDLLEPGRTFMGLDFIRNLAEESLDRAFEEAYAHCLGYLISQRKLMHPVTLEVWNSLISDKGVGRDV